MVSTRTRSPRNSNASESSSSSSSSSSLSSSPPPMSSVNTSSPSSEMTLTDLVFQHFDNHQKRGVNGGTTSEASSSSSKKKKKHSTSSATSASVSDNDEVRRSANLLRDELSAQILSNLLTTKAKIAGNDNEEDDEILDLSVKDEVSNAILSAIDCSMATCLASLTNVADTTDGGKRKKSPTAASLANAPYMESIQQILNLSACFACVDGDGSLSEHVVSLATKYSQVEMEIIRVLGCKLLGYCGLYLSDSMDEVEVRKKKMLKKRHQMKKNRRSDGRVSIDCKESEDALSFLFGEGQNPKEDDSEEEESWRSECIDLVAEALLPRLTDKSQSVRNAAIQSCAFLKIRSVNKEEEEECNEIKDALTEALFRSAAHDSSFACRAAALKSVPITSSTISSVIERIRDVKVKVRVEAIDVIASSDLDVKDLTEEQMVDIIQFGLTERCTQTYAATAQLICCNWMKRLRFDPVAFLRLLDPAVNETICEKAARVILRATRDDDDDTYNRKQKNNRKQEEETKNDMGVSTTTTLRQLSDNEIHAYKEGVSAADSSILRSDDDNEDSLDVATILYLRMICEDTMESKKLSAYQKAETVGKILPDIPVLCDILRKHLGRLVGSKKSRSDASRMEEESEADEQEASIFEDNECFICLQLLQICKVADLKEEGSRRAFVSLIRELLCSLETPDDLIECCVRALAVSHDTEAHFIQTISDVLYHVGETDSFNAHDDADESSSASPEIDAEGLRHLRAVAILSVVLESTSEHLASNPTVQSFAGHILPAITSSNATVREGGVCCLGKFAILSDEETLRDFKPLLLKIIGSDAEKMEVRAQAALAASDLALRFESVLEPCPEPNAENEENDCESLCFSSMVFDMLNDSKPGLVVIAAEIAAKLLFAGRLRDSNVVARLLMIFFDESFVSSSLIEGDDDVKEVGSPVRLEQILSLFFPAYCMKSDEGRDVLLGCVPTILAMIWEKVSGRKRKAWPTVKMIEYVCSIVDMADNRKQQLEASSNDKNSEVPSAENSVTEDTGDDTAEKKEEKTTASSALMTSIAIALYLTKESHNLPVTYLRTLCKLLGGANIDIEFDESSRLGALKKLVDDLEVAIEDTIAHRSIEKLVATLSSVESDDEVSSDDESGDELIEAMKHATLDESHQHSGDRKNDLCSLNDENVSENEVDHYDDEDETKENKRNSRSSSLSKSEGTIRRTRRALAEMN